MVLNGPLKAGAGRQRPGSWEAREIHMFNNLATGIRSGLLPQDCEVATNKLSKKIMLGEVFARVLTFGDRGWRWGGFREVLVGLPHVFDEGLAPPQLSGER